MTNEEAIESLNGCIVSEEYENGKANGNVTCDLTREILDMAIAALRAQQERENPKPLSLDELREMDGEPVYCVYPGCSTGGEWFIINKQGAYKNGSFLNFRYYGEWLAYRYKKEADK